MRVPRSPRERSVARQQRHRVRFTTTAALVSELIEARDEKKLLRFQKQIASYELLIVDELGFVPLSKTGAELLFEMLSQRYERGSTLITSNLPFLLGTFALSKLCGFYFRRTGLAQRSELATPK
jgi:DNA replication protein DnaC